MKDYYKILLIDKSATENEIKHSFRLLAHKYHPDKNSGIAEFASKFIEIKEAYDILSDKLKRAEYDTEYKKNFKDKTILKSEINDFYLQTLEYKIIFEEISKYSKMDSGQLLLQELNASILLIENEFTKIQKTGKLDENIKIYLNSALIHVSLTKTDEIMNDIMNMLLSTPDKNTLKFSEKDRIEGAFSWANDIFNLIIVPLKRLKGDEYSMEKLYLKEDYYQELFKNLESNYNKSNSKQGCYIATFVYGDYENENVIILREFRDNVISKSILGKLFIKFYYRTSPILIKIFKNNAAFKNVSKKLIETLVKNLS